MPFDCRPLSPVSSLLFALLFALVWISSLWVAATADAAGLLAPTDQTLPPLRITDHSVSATIRDGVALTKVTQTFHNATSRRLEATYVFPLPEDGDLTDFRMTFNGKMVQGSVLPAEEAARIYESIVRQSRDPGLIEFIGRRLLQMRVFPIEPRSDTTIEVSYQQICRPIGGMVGYHYPLRTSKTSGQAYGTVRFDVELHTSAPLKSIWSPTHAVEIVRAGDERSARIGYEATNQSLDDDFLLLFDTDASDLGMSVVAHKPTTGAPGHFVLMLTPKQLWERDAYEPQDVVFVMDTSGSMAGDKIEQARRALKFCVDRLDERDRFAVVRFSTGFDDLFSGLRDASAENRAEAGKWIEGFAAAGGTNIADTLQHVVGLRDDLRVAGSKRPFVVVFVTDGKGNREPAEILAALEKSDDAAAIRFFPFGVGHDVNTVLLDRLADRFTGRPTYVQPGQDLELVLGDFFSIVSRPVLTRLRLELPGVGATEQFPAVLGDLYHGQQLVVAAQYANPVRGPVTLRAMRGGREVEYVWPHVSFEPTAGADYVPTVWAGRKIAYLIDQIRMHGESKEMISEVVALSQKYGIQTPYSSWLVNPEQVAGAPRPTDGRRFALSLGARTRIERDFGVNVVDVRERSKSAPTYGDGFGVIDAAQAERAVTLASGAAANIIARKNAALRTGVSREVGRMDTALLARRQIGDRWYVRVGRVLVDQAIDDDTAITVVRFGSTAYFEIARTRPDLRAALAASREAAVIIGSGRAVLVSDKTGLEKFSSAEREQLGLDSGS